MKAPAGICFRKCLVFVLIVWGQIDLGEKRIDYVVTPTRFGEI